MDPVLLDILSREVAVHLGAIREFAARAGEAASQPLPERIFRACHTLHGSLTMAGVRTAVAVAGPLNDLMGVLYTARLPADAAIINATSETADVVARIIEQLRAAEPATSAVTTEVGTTVRILTGRLLDLLAQAGERAAALSAESVDGGTASMPIPALSEQDLAEAADELAESLPWVASVPVIQLEGEPPAVEADLTEVFAVGEMDFAEPAPDPELIFEPEPELQPRGDGVSVDDRGVAAVATAAGWDAEVADIFAEEASEILEACDQAITRLAARQDEERALAELQRGLHTLKGGARMSGLFAMGDLSHDLETLRLRMADGVLPRGAETYGLVQASLDELHVLRDQIPAGIAATPSPVLLERLAAALRGEVAVSPDAAATPTESVSAPV
jgi:chemosensory pili system protein ChpA (sensor histidine kinase/response regulator)